MTHRLAPLFSLAATASLLLTGTAAATPPATTPWTLELAAGDHAAGVVGAVHRDGGNVVGMAVGATDGLDDATDAPEPGAPGGAHVQLFVRGPGSHPVFGDRFMRQVVGAVDLTDAHYDFALVVSAVGYDGQSVGIEAADLSAVPAGYGLYLLDGIVQHDLRAGPYAFDYDGVRALTLRVGKLPAPEMPPQATPPGLPSGTVPVGRGTPFTWDPVLQNASEVAIQRRRTPGRRAAGQTDDWEDLVAGIDPRAGTYAFTPPLSLRGPGHELRLVARNGAGDETELGRTTVDVDYGDPEGAFGNGGGPLASGFTVGAAATVPFQATSAGSATLHYSADGGATWAEVAGPLANPAADLSDAWADAFAGWAPGAGHISYGGLFRLDMDVPRLDGSVGQASAVSDPVTVVPTALDWALEAGFQMVSLPFDPDGQVADDVFVEGGSGEALGSLFLYTYAPSTFYTLLGNADDPLPAGRGFWAASGTGGAGQAGGAFGRGPHTVALGQNGWAMVGVPFALGVTPDHLTFSDGVQTKSYAEAVAAFWVSPGLYTWAGGAYHDRSDGVLAPWSAFWLPVFADDLTLTVAPPAPAPVAADAVAGADEPFWALVADVEHAGGAADRTTGFGVHPEASVVYDRFDRPEPPPPPSADVVRAYSVRTDWGVPFSQFDREAQPMPEAGETREWPLTIEAPAGEVQITWSLPSPPAGLPALAFELVDDDGTRRPLADGGTFTYDADGTRRAFRVVATRRGGVAVGAPPSAAFQAVVAPNPVRGATAVLVTSAEAGEVAVGVFDALGRRVLDVRERVPAGAARIALPTGSLAPGRYVVRVTGPTGSATRALTVSR